jgi:hypothetical protein
MMAKGGKIGHYKIGDIVKVSKNNDNENYDDFRDKNLRIVDKITIKDNHPAFDESLEDQALYSFEDVETEESIPFSLYDYELESAKMADGGMMDLIQFDRDINGSLYDRGHSDSYYGRAREPHWYPNGTYKGEKVTELTKKEIEEYNKGYNENTDFKDYGYADGGMMADGGMLEAEEYIGSDKWNKMSYEEKIASADYLIKTGRIEGEEMSKGGKVKRKRWIQDALSGDHKGALREIAKRKHLLKGDENLSLTDLHKLEKMGGKTAKRAHLAETLRKFK